MSLEEMELVLCQNSFDCERKTLEKTTHRTNRTGNHTKKFPNGSTAKYAQIDQSNLCVRTRTENKADLYFTSDVN